VPVLSNQPRVYFGFASLCFIPMILRIASEGDVYSLQLAGELLLIVSLTTLLARSYRQALQRVTELKLQADGLLAQLRVEKRLADVARQEAEVARHDAEVANRAEVSAIQVVRRTPCALPVSDVVSRPGGRRTPC
jgi:hypothetical protein